MNFPRHPKKIYIVIQVCLALTFILYSSPPQAAEIFSLRNIQTGGVIPPLNGKSIIDSSPLSFSPNNGKPSIILFFTLRPPFRQKRSLNLIMQMNELVQTKYKDRVSLVSVFSDTEEGETVKKFINDGLIIPPVINDSNNEIYNQLGVFMTPIAVLATSKGTLHEVIPATYNSKEIVENNLKFLLGEWTEEEFQNSFNASFNKAWTPEEKEYIRRINYGKIMYNRKMYSPAIREFTTASKIQPNSAEAHIGLGLIYYDMKKFDKAEKSFSNALKITPDSDQALAGMGLTLNKKNDIDRALPILENALISEDPKIDVIVTLAEIYEKKGEIKKAMRLNKMAISRLRQNF